ncbi:MAG TPA: SDR family oxidoreductase [Polyangia bacterium]|jgi:NAD(P)-dependent dehydrogenase (short-subunit alcohol dehydrogenase family)|nr:SDR family oxidoreductase [Polyangia bacterium]
MSAGQEIGSQHAAAPSPVVLITGSSSGIGRATAISFARKGWRVFASMRHPETAADLRDEAAHQGWALTTPQLDVNDDASVTDAVGAALGETQGRLDVVINNAGFYTFGPLEETSPDELRAQLETNVVGVHRVTRAVLPAMRARRDGAIVTLGSISGRVAVPIAGPYHASKWALEGMVETLRYELLPFGIRVTLIEPGPFRTALHHKEVQALASQRPDSPYASLLAAYKHQAMKMHRAELDEVVEVIYRAATHPDPGLRWPVGPTSFSAGRLRAFCPDRLYEWVLRIGFPIRTSSSGG